MRTAVDLINLFLSAPLDGAVLERVWTGKDVFYKRLKLDDKAKECIFLGYRHEEFGYRLWDLVARKLIRSRDFVFLEDQIVVDEEKSDGSQSSPEIPIIPTSVSPLIVHDDHGGVGKDNNDGLAERIIMMV